MVVQFYDQGMHNEMRLSTAQISAIRTSTSQLAGNAARIWLFGYLAIWLFGSRLHDDTRGSDVDLLLERDTPVAEPAQPSAQLAVQVARAMCGRKVDVLIKAPNLMQLPIHSIALAEGIRL